MASIALADVTKRYKGVGGAAVDHVTLDIADGEFFVLLGPSGCGKSTLLKMIAGLEEPDEGLIYLGDDIVNYTTPGARNVAMVFQNYALYPHMSVRRNLEFPLKMRRVPKARRRELVEQTARALELDPLLDRSVGQLSGGQRQRVALGRAIVRDPRAMLMDEPLSNLDALLRMQTRDEVLRVQRSVGTTTIYVTHDQVEAMTMGDRIAVMDRGRMIQIGTPSEVYDSPRTVFVGGFLGHPPMNFLDGEVLPAGARLTFVTEGLRLELPEDIADEVSPVLDERSVTLGIRPEHIELQPAVHGSTPAPWRVTAVDRLGADSIVSCSSGANSIRARAASRFDVTSGDLVRLLVDLDAIHLFDRTGVNMITTARPAQAAWTAIA